MRSWRTWPPRAWALLGALVLFSVAVLSVLYWAQFTGRAGTQRGLVIHNDLEINLMVEVEGVDRREISAGHEETFVVKRDQFPTTISAWLLPTMTENGIARPIDPAGFARPYEYREIADAEFRLSVDDDGFHPTTTLRDTPVPQVTVTP